MSEADRQEEEDQREKSIDVSKVPDVVVEDASDDEDDDDITSAWRNRRPAPGVLMEPIRSFR